jgi:carbon storage regulator
MLVLGRKRGESIVIGERVHITVLEIAGGQVRLGIDAPRDVVILREELVHRSHSPATIGAYVSPDSAIPAVMGAGDTSAVYG